MICFSEGYPLRRLLLRVKGGLVGEFVFGFHGRPPEEASEYHISPNFPQREWVAVCGGGALTRVETIRQTSVPATGRTPLSHAPAHSVVQQGEWDLCQRAFPAELCRVAARLGLPPAS